jgi:TatD DNase family protein
MRLFDTHTHLQFGDFNQDRNAVLERASAAGVHSLVVVGTDATTSDAAVDLAQTSDWIHAAVGCHPHDAGAMSDGDLDYLAALARLDCVVAVGEIGLDLYRELSTRHDQERALMRQLELAVEVRKPVIVHSRSAEDEILPFMAGYCRAKRESGWDRSRPIGIMHAFGGTVDQASRFVEAGFLVSIPCTVTYPKNDRTVRLAEELPLDALVVETDCPYLPPQARRGKRNEPANVSYAVTRIAEARRLAPEEIAAATSANARRVFGLDEEPS